jgi:DnaK suppressor protein
MTDDTPWWLQDDPDVAAPLTPAERAELHADLLTLQTELARQLDEPSDRDDTVDLDQPIGRLSRMDALQQQKMAQAQRGRIKVRMSQISLALRAWEDEEFGDCRTCGECIGYARLKAQPESPLCMTCAVAAESRRR